MKYNTSEFLCIELRAWMYSSLYHKPATNEYSQPEDPLESRIAAGQLVRMLRAPLSHDERIRTQ